MSNYNNCCYFYMSWYWCFANIFLINIRKHTDLNCLKVIWNYFRRAKEQCFLQYCLCKIVLLITLSLNIFRRLINICVIIDSSLTLKIRRNTFRRSKDISKRCLNTLIVLYCLTVCSVLYTMSANLICKDSREATRDAYSPEYRSQLTRNPTHQSTTMDTLHYLPNATHGQTTVIIIIKGGCGIFDPPLSSL